MKIMLTELFRYEGHRNFQGDQLARAIARHFGVRAVCNRVPDVPGMSQIQVSADFTVTKKQFANMQQYGAGYLDAIRDADAGVILSA